MHRVYLFQLETAWENKEANFENVRRLFARHKPERRSLVVLPEMFATGFTMNATQMAESAGGATHLFLQTLARAYNVYIIGGLPGRVGKRFTNQAVVYSPAGRCLGSYSKMQPFSVGDEKRHYQAGEKPFLFKWEGARVAVFICFDLRFPEIFRMAPASGAEMFVVIANWPVTRIHHWTRLLQARAIENQAFVIGVNRSGKDPSYRYSGGSLVSDPHGELVLQLGTREGVGKTALSLAALQKYRRDLPFLRDAKGIKLTK